MMKWHLAVFFVTCFSFCVFVTSITVHTLPFPPPRDQVEILLAFKNEFPSRNCDHLWKPVNYGQQLYGPNISSWTKDASSFDGVMFDEETGAVTELDLGYACINGTIRANSSLFRFQHLRYLDLSMNHFESSPLPAGFGRLTNLRSLYLSQNGFIGEVPSSISNLSRLTSLDLSHNKLTGSFPQIHNLTLLSYVDLSYNHFSETIPSSLFTMHSLSYLDLRENHLRDPLENMSSSATSKLVYLNMAKNLLSCRILEPISKLPNLTYLDLSFQNTTYTINFDFLPFKSLKYLDLSGNRVSRLNTGSTNLWHLTLSSCNITKFPTFIKILRNLRVLGISKNSLRKVPEWLWNLPFLIHVDLSHNSINILEGSPKLLLNLSLSELNLDSNAFQGSFPVIPPTIETMEASNNNFTGDIPLTFCNASKLRLLDLSNNNFGGSIPQCLTRSVLLGMLILSNNNLKGRLPDLDIESRLETFDVGHNQISGKLPRSLVNCKSLMFLNVESNRISDTFPFWLKALPDLEVIVLKSNKFHGLISSPENPLSFPVLRIIDISRNNFNGTMPPNYFVNWSSPLINVPQRYHWPRYTGDWHSKYPEKPWYYPSIDLRNKGREMELEKILKTYTAIDFSGNKLGGKIPESIGLLKSLIMLDLSNNNFTGHIPSSLAKLTQLESLDISRNQLSGRIPQELSVLTFLAYVNMSNNKLTGQIPHGTQIGGQPKSCFEGNIDLCGLPLQENCFEKNVPSTPPKLPKQEQVLNWKAAAIGYGAGVLLGLAIGQVFASYKPMLFYRLFRF